MNKKIVLIIAIIVIAIIAITVPLVIVFTRKSNKPIITTAAPINTMSIVASGLSSSGLVSINRTNEGFENPPTTSIVFDTVEKIMLNFEVFINLYFPKLKDIIADVNATIAQDTDYFSPNSTVYTILAEAAPYEEYRTRFKLKPIIDIYSHLLLTETNDETMNNNFNLAMIGLVIFLNAKDMNKTYEIVNSNGETIKGSVVYKYNSDYEITKELKIFMDSGINMDKPLKKEHSLHIEKECISDNLCYTTSEELKVIYMKDTMEDTNMEKERKKKEVATDIDKYKKVLELLFIANLKLMLNPDYNNINQVLNDSNDRNNRELAGLRGILVSSIKSNHFKLDETDIPSNIMNNIKIIGDGILYRDIDGKMKRVKMHHTNKELLNKLKTSRIREIRPEIVCANMPNENCSNAFNLLNSLCTNPTNNNVVCNIESQLNTFITTYNTNIGTNNTRTGNYTNNTPTGTDNTSTSTSTSTSTGSITYTTWG